MKFLLFFFFQAEDGIRDGRVTGVQTCALPIFAPPVQGHEVQGEREAASARQHNSVALGGGNLAVLKTIAFVRSVTKRFRRRAPTSAQHNDFRRFAVFPGWGRQFLPAGRYDPHRALYDQGAVRLRRDGHGGHLTNIAARWGPGRGISRVRSQMHTRFSLIGCVAAGATVAACIGERGPFINRMAHTGTSYLARAARQPVRWQPWGRDAFALAAKLDRPVLLYIGSDACRWCAETDRAIYTDPAIGGLINALFVPIRVDRDERPDVAQRYQAAVEHLAGLHGWPLIEIGRASC